MAAIEQILGAYSAKFNADLETYFPKAENL